MTVKAGDRIRIIDVVPVSRGLYEIGDEMVVETVWTFGSGVDTESGIELYMREFEVVNEDFSTSEIAKRVAMASTLGYTIEEFDTAIGVMETTTPHGKELRIYTGTDVDGDFLTHITVGIDEATGVMYVLGMKTEVVE